VADDSHAAALQVEDRRDHQRDDDDDERPGELRQPELGREQQAHEGQPENEGEDVRLADPDDQLSQQRKEVLLHQLDAEELAELSRDEDQRRAAHVADQHGFRQEVGDHPHAQARREQHQRSPQKRGRGREIRRARRVRRGERRHGADDQQGDGAIGPSDHVR
jgi:hypothetical protein